MNQHHPQGQQPNSQLNEKATENENKIVAAVADFYSALSAAASWQRKEVPADSPLSFALRFLPALLLPVLLTLSFY